MSEELRKRIITGILGAVVIIGLVIWGGWVGITFLATFLSLAMIYEFAKMVFTLPDHPEKLYALLCLTWFAAMANFIMPRSEFEIGVASFIVLFSYFLFSAGRYQAAQISAHFKELMYSFFGMLYLVFLPFYLVRIHQSSFGVHWTIVFLLVNWAGDVGAYFSGKKFGRRKLYPAISPKKTLEGSVGGLLSGLGVTLIYKWLVFGEMPWGAVLVIPVVVGLFAQVGDLCESFMKRSFDRKDSGSLLPGHGGFLDRFDGVVFSLPVMYACVRVFGA